MNKKQYLTVADIATRSYKRAGLPKEWTAHMGDPELGQTIIVWGQSASGKSYYAMKLAKGFAEAGHRVLYYPLEEGITASYNEKIVNCQMADVSRRFFTARDNFSIDSLAEVLTSNLAPKVVVVDSVQYSAMSYEDYKEIRRRWPNVTLIFVSHADGPEPRGSVATSIRYDAGVKVRVVAKRAKADSRFGGREDYIIDRETVEQIDL